jgi:endo-alpha-1,4-polygalactosaminidase (GH114 family)
MDNIEQQEELFAQLRALSCAFNFSLELGKTILTVEYANTKKSAANNKITDFIYNEIVSLVKGYYDAEVVTSGEYNTKFLIRS